MTDEEMTQLAINTIRTLSIAIHTVMSGGVPKLALVLGTQIAFLDGKK
jgi:hypothetical protein